MRLIFMGSDPFALPLLAALLESKHTILEVVTQSDKPSGRGQNVEPCPVAHYAREHQLPLYQPSTLKTPEVQHDLARHNADLFVVAAYGKMLPDEILALPPKGCVNVHPSLLPKYRGPAPMTWAIANGDKETGVATMYLTSEMDAGDIIFIARTAIDECERAPALEERLASMGADLLITTIDAIAEGKAPRTPQDATKVTFAPMLTKEDGHIDWKLLASVIFNRVRAFDPWPGSYTMWEGKRLHLHEVAVVDKPCHEKPGTVVACDTTIAVATGEKLLYLLEVQLEGKNRMSTDAFLRGNHMNVGTLLT